MQKRCKNCIYRGYEKRDKNEVWPFCMNESEEIRKVATEWKHKIDTLSRKTEIPKDRVFACAMVQAGYSELYNRECPFREERKRSV